MPLTADQRKAIISHLTANCDCWKQPGDAQVLASFSDEKLQALKEHADKEAQAITVANAAVAGFSHEGKAYRVNPETGKWETKPVEITPPPQPPPAANAGKKADPDDDDDDPDDEEMERYRSRTNKRRMSGNRARDDYDPPPKPKSFEEWMKLAPAEWQATLNAAKAVEDREKSKIVNELLNNSNCTEAERPAFRDYLQAKQLDDLTKMLALYPKAPSNPEPAYLSRVGNVSRPEDDMLGLPNWEQVDGSKSSAAATANVHQEQGMGDDEREAILRQLPPGLRSEVQNARVLVDRERRKIIDELTANLDGEAERNLRYRLSNKSLEELRDLLALAPHKETARPTYFGSSAPLANTRPNDANEDVLPLPSWDWKSVASS